MRSFDSEFGSNPYLFKPGESDFEPWDSHRIDVRTRDGDDLKLRSIEHFYSYWHVHIVALLQKHGYYRNAWLVKQLPAEALEWCSYRVPEDPDFAQTLRGMNKGYDVLTRFVSARILTVQSMKDLNDGFTVRQADLPGLTGLLAADARRVLLSNEFDEPDWFLFIQRLIELRRDYEREEKLKLAA